MKKFIVVLTLIAMTALPFRSAEANLEQVSIRRFAVLSTVAACAVNIQILSIVNNQLNGSEALLLNGQIFAVFTAAILLAGLSANQFVLFGSPAFASESGITPDVMLSDQQCEDLQEGDEFAFQGSQGSVVSTAVLALIGLSLLFAIVLNLDTNVYGEFALSVFFLTIASLVTQVLIGNVDGQNAEDFGTGGGCSLQKADSNAQNIPWGLLLLGFLGMGSAAWMFRRRLMA